jgi:N-acetylglucosamine malate deacetylase 1
LRFLLATLRRLAAGHERIFRFLHSWSLFEQAVTVTVAGAESILVLAPHMDDEVLGCGGTVAAHADAGARITLVFLTSGRYGAGPEAPEQLELIAARKHEAGHAAKIIGATSSHLIDGMGNRLETDVAAAARLRAILEQERPEIVYLPFFLERHPDHRAAGDVLAAAVRGTGLDFECRAYEVWTPLVPNRAIAIDATVERKRAAVRCYKTQLDHTDFTHITLALNAYRSGLVPGGACQYAEAFHSLPLARYLALHRAFHSAVPT